MKFINRIYQFALFAVLLLMTGISVAEAQVSFKASAPRSVVQGEQFRLSYTLNKEGNELQLNADLKDFEVLYGPSVSRSYSRQTINGKTTSESSFTYTYILVAPKTGNFNIGPATVKVDGSQYKSNSFTVEVLPPDKSSQSQSNSGSSSRGSAIAPSQSSSSGGKVNSNDAFIRAIISKNDVYEQEGFTVTFRLYTTLNVVNFGKIEFPEFEGFMVEEVPFPSNQQLKMERYNGRNYYTADLRKTLLFPQRSGRINIPSGKLEMVFSVPSGKKIETFFGSQEVMVDVAKTLVTNPVSINVRPLPNGKPDNFSGGVGTFSFKSSISTTDTKANEPVTVKLEISGTGNLKLIQNPKIEFPSNFEVYDPTINNNIQIATNGTTGTKVIEYLAIPRYEGTYDISSIEFSYFDLGSGTYKTLSSPAYDLKVAKADPSKASSSNFINKQDVEVEQDIRFIKTKDPDFQPKSVYFVGSFSYWLWYFIPLLLLIILYLFNRKQAIESANITLMRNKKANKVATKRLKIAEKYLKDAKKTPFYEEMLRAIWGYFSDKLSIPVVSLSKDNVGTELSKKGIDEMLIDKFMNILHTCEFAQYSPAESSTAMDEVYKETVEAIDEMESRLKKVDTVKKQ
ncbi:MAG: BatD family protein [Dysgonamonadaceae bacterium]